MRHGYEHHTGRLLDFGFAATILLGMVALAMLSSRQPARRLRIARLGLIGVLSLPLLDQIQSLPRFDLGPETAEAFGHFFEWAAPGLSGWAGRTWSAIRPRSFDAILSWVGLLYLAGAAIGFARLGLGWLGGRWLLARARRPDEGLIRFYESIPFSRRDRPALLVSDRIRRPMLIGVFRPTILMPTALAAPDAPHVAAALVHELAHAESSDPLFGLLAEFLMVVGFPIPPLWWIRRQARLDQEFAADAHAAAMMGDAASYASSLVSIAGTMLGGSGVGRAAITGETREGSNLYRRVLLLLRPRFPVELRPSILWLSYCTAVLFGITLVVATINARPSWSGSASSRPDPADRMRFTNVTLGPRRSVSLPFPGTGDFTLEGDIVCATATLGKIRVLGLPLRAAAPEPADSTVGPHHFVATVGERRVQLVVDGRPVATIPQAEPFRSLLVASEAEESITLSALTVIWGCHPPK